MNARANRANLADSADRAVRDWLVATAASTPPRPFPQATVRPKVRRGFATGAAVIILVMAIGGVVGFRPGGPFVAQVRPSELTAVTAVPTGVTAVPMGVTAVPTATSTPTIKEGSDEDGLPLSIEGMDVLRGEEIEAQVVAAVDDSPFFIAGWTVLVLLDCTDVVPDNPLESPCPYGRFLSDTAGTPSGPPAPETWLDGDGIPLPQQAWVVLRVHVRDERAAGCPADLRDRCERAIVADDLVWQRPGP